MNQEQDHLASPTGRAPAALRFGRKETNMSKIEQRWLAIPAGGDTVRLLPVPVGSAGPDVFCKVNDAQAAVAEAKLDLRSALQDLLAQIEAVDGTAQLNTDKAVSTIQRSFLP